MSKESQTETFFYVFIGIGKNGEPKDHSGLDEIVKSAFSLLKPQFPGEAVVHINPERFHDLRRVFEIRELPAFGISDVEISDQKVEVRAADPPHRWNLWKRREREEILSSGKLFPRVERRIIEAFPGGTHDLFHFIRDLHIANIDNGLPGVQKRIESQRDSLGLQTAMSVVVSGRKLILGTG